MVPHERYTLTLRHEYVDPDGQPNYLEEPIVVSYHVLHTDKMPSAIVINELMELMRMHMISAVEQKGDQNDRLQETSG